MSIISPTKQWLPPQAGLTRRGGSEFLTEFMTVHLIKSLVVLEPQGFLSNFGDPHGTKFEPFNS